MAETSRRKAVVTGGAAGLGRAVALRLARSGYEIAVLDHDIDGARSTARQVGGHAVHYDATGHDLATEAFEAAVGLLGGADLLVCAAHVEYTAPTEEITIADFQRVLRTNLGAPVFAAQALSRQLAQSDDGCIVVLSSVHARIGSGAHAAYSAAMAGLAAVGRCLAAELEPTGVRCTTVSPYTALTESTRPRLADPSWRDLQESTVLSGRIMSAQEVADVVDMVASPIGRLLNAADLVVDGGMNIFRERPERSAYETTEEALR